MSLVELTSIDGLVLSVNGLDLLDGTPVLDIKPYLPYADSVADANAGWLSHPVERFEVRFLEEVLLFFRNLSDGEKVKILIEQMLELDPRPTSQRRAYSLFDPKTEHKKFAFRVMDFDVHWRVARKTLEVYEIINLLDI